MESHHLTAIDMLARGLPAEHVAKKLNVSDRTVRRWKLIPEFAEELRLAMETYRSTLEARYDRIVGKCQVLTDEALEKIALVMRNSLDARICLGAANMLLNHCTRMARRHIDLANVANAADLEKADKKGRESAAVHLETPRQDRTSSVTAAQQPEAAKAIAPVQPMSATGHTGRVGATDAPTAVPSVHPCPDDQPTPKADTNENRPETPSTSTAMASRHGTDESGVRRPDASVAPILSQIADVNGHRPAETPKSSATLKPTQQGGTEDTALASSLASTKFPPKADKTGRGLGATEQTAVSFAPCWEDPKLAKKADANGLCARATSGAAV